MRQRQATLLIGTLCPGTLIKLGIGPGDEARTLVLFVPTRTGANYYSGTVTVIPGHLATMHPHAHCIRLVNNNIIRLLQFDVLFHK